MQLKKENRKKTRKLRVAVQELLFKKHRNCIKLFWHHNIGAKNCIKRTFKEALEERKNRLTSQFYPSQWGGQIPQLWNFQDVTENCGYASPGNPKTPWVRSQTSKLTFCIAFQFMPFFCWKNDQKQPKKPSKVPFFNAQSWARLVISTKSAQLWAFKNCTCNGMK